MENGDIAVVPPTPARPARAMATALVAQNDA